MLGIIIDSISTFMYSKLLVILLIGAGIYFTIRTKLPQMRLFKDACKAVVEKPEDEKRTDHEGNRKSINEWIKNSLRNRLTDLKKNLRFSLWLQLWLLPMTAWFYYEVQIGRAHV